MTYGSSAAVLADRIRWATARLAELLCDAQDAGWVVGTAKPPAIASDLLWTALHDRFSTGPLDVDVAPMEWLRLRLALSARQFDALWLLACVELDPAVARLAEVFGGSDCPDISVQIWQRLVPLSADDFDRLIDLALIETSNDVRLPRHRRSVRVTDRVLELAHGELRLDPMVGAFGALVPPTPSRLGYARTELPSAASLLVAIGVEGAGRATLLRDAAHERGVGVLEIRVDDLATEPEMLRRQLRATCREAMLFGVVPLLRELGLKDTRAELIQVEVLTNHVGLVMATASQSPAWVTARPLVVVPVQPLTSAERARVWEAMLGDDHLELVQAVSERYAITPGAIVATSNNARARVNGARALTAEDLHDGLRAHLGQRLGGLAKRIEWRQTWDDLVLPEAQREQVAELTARVRHRRDVLETQGFAVKTAKGNGLVGLLSGDPGTGKTMVAGLVAAELGLDLYQVDLSNVVSKYIGETEKGLAKLFDAAESGHIVLLFDEADALFAKRSDVKSSNDRYANLETNYLLQRLEAFAGITLLTTNHDAALDDAFRRRIAVHIRFPMPEESERARLWKTMLPAHARVESRIDLRGLAREYDMSGGHIKNAVMRAAYLAAARGVPIGMDHLRSAAQSEFEAMGRISTANSRL